MDERKDWHLTDALHHEQGRGDPFAAAVRATRMPMIITDPKLPDNPIVFANEAFQKLTGYDREEILGGTVACCKVRKPIPMRLKPFGPR